MKAWVYEDFGDVNVLRLDKTVSVPKIRDDQVLIKVIIATLNHVDYKRRQKKKKGIRIISPSRARPSGVRIDRLDPDRSGAFSKMPPKGRLAGISFPVAACSKAGQDLLSHRRLELGWPGAPLLVPPSARIVWSLILCVVQNTIG
ncbi:Quinone oxidoreductase-like protein [Platanthera zijinensis]|uniref:Quinone oxidoreductase-like protein n=1 Tax=Platanthera zijinensis TaxID=2320716 RepID=A0AAP0AST8_9ASPA